MTNLRDVRPNGKEPADDDCRGTVQVRPTGGGHRRGRRRGQTASRARPASGASLAELLCFAGDFERADKQLDAIGAPGPADGRGRSALFRQLLRAEQARQQFSRRGAAARVSRPAVAAAASGTWRRRSGSARGSRPRPPPCSTRPKQQRPALPGTCDGAALRRPPRHRRPDGARSSRCSPARASTIGFRWSGSR